MAEPVTDILRFTYTGRIANQGRLNFYEFGRAYYGAARLVYTIARFRETGKVLSKITERVDTLILAEPPQRGSFFFDAIAYLGPVVANAAVDAPISAIFAWMWDNILPQSKIDRAIESDLHKELAGLETKRAIALSREETKRLKFIRDILTSKDRTIEQLIEVQKTFVAQANAKNDGPQERIGRTRLTSLKNAQAREQLIAPHRLSFDAIPSQTVEKLEGRMRSITPELGLPLRSSADEISLGTPSNKTIFARLDRKEIDEIDSERADDLEYRLRCRIIRYDRAGRYGKLKTNEPNKEFGEQEFFFRLAPGTSRETHFNVIDAMHLDDVRGIFTVYRDKTGKVERLVMHDIELN